MKDDELETKLLALPGEIKAHQENMMQTAAKYEDKTKEVQIKKLSVSDFIMNNDDAKKKYTNADARKAAVDVQLALDADYQLLLKDEKVLEQKVQLERIDLEFLHNTFIAVRAIADMRSFT